MARYTTEPDDAGLTIHVHDVGSGRERLLESFQECRAGRCDCPTEEYEKLASLSIDVQPDAITLRLDAAPGQTLDPAAIDACLRYTVDKAERATE